MSHITPAKPRGRAQRQTAIRRQVSTLDTPAMVANIVDTYTLAVKHNARSWYGEANEQARAYAAMAGLPVRSMVGIIAALSPSTAWERNLSLALTLAETGDCAHAYGDCIRKARRIRDGADPYEVLGGRKVRSFFRNLLYPHRSGAVTIDRHAFSIALSGVPTTERERRTHTLHESELKRLDRPGVYAMVAGCYRAAARRLGVDAHDLQSITWDYWRDHHAYGVTTNIERF